MFGPRQDYLVVADGKDALVVFAHGRGVVGGEAPAVQSDQLVVAAQNHIAVPCHHIVLPVHVVAFAVLHLDGCLVQNV